MAGAFFEPSPPNLANLFLFCRCTNDITIISGYIWLFRNWKKWKSFPLQLFRASCIKSLYQLFLLSNCIESSISSLGIKSPYQVFYVKSLYQFSVSSLCITFSCSVFFDCIKSLYQDIIPSRHIKSLYQVFVSSLRIKVFVSKSSYQVFVSCLNYWLNKFCKRTLKSSRSFAILQLCFSLWAKKYLF